eukprot:5550707-Pyramimonas_sp.AAC.1
MVPLPFTKLQSDLPPRVSIWARGRLAPPLRPAARSSTVVCDTPSAPPAARPEGPKPSLRRETARRDPLWQLKVQLGAIGCCSNLLPRWHYRAQ